MEERDQPDKLALLRRIWLAPDSFKPKVTNRDTTKKAARSFANLADGLRKRGAQTGESADTVRPIPSIEGIGLTPKPRLGYARKRIVLPSESEA